MKTRLIVALVVASCIGCGDDSAPLLLVDVRTDLAPGVEFDEVRTSASGMVVNSAASAGQDFLAGRRVAEIEGLAEGRVQLEVRLASGGTQVVRRPVEVDFSGTTAVSIVITRDCRSVSCPRDGDAPELTACLSGRCVPPACSDQNVAACGIPECSTAAECGCAGAVCATGVCLCGGGDDAGMDGGVDAPLDAPLDASSDGGTTCRDRAPISAVDVGRQHVCAIRDDGALYCWGAGTSGQLGNRTDSDSLVPDAVEGSGWTRVALAKEHTCGVRSGQLYCWGRNEAGELGQGDMDNRSAPALVVGGGDEGIDGLDAIDAVSAVVSGGDIYAWGNGAQGRLGIGSTMSLDMPSTPAIRPMGVTWAAIALGDDAAYAIDDGGGLWSWGLNDDGQLGTGDGMDQTSPTRVDTPSTSFVQVAGGNAAACAISTMDQLFCWGSSSDDRLPTSSSTTPIAAGGSFDYVTLATGPDGSDRGGHHGCALSGDELFCWGENAAGELGLGDLTSRSTPTALPGAWSSVSTDGAATCAINDVGELWCWGSNTHGQLGQGNREDSLVPVRVCLEP